MPESMGKAFRPSHFTPSIPGEEDLEKAERQIHLQQYISRARAGLPLFPEHKPRSAESREQQIIEHLTGRS